MRSENEIDAWALKREFFSKFFEVARKELFENIDDMPWYDVVKFSKRNLRIFKIFGIVIPHILLKQAAYFSFLAPWVLETSGCETLSGISASIYCIEVNTFNRDRKDNNWFYHQIRTGLVYVQTRN